MNPLLLGHPWSRVPAALEWLEPDGTVNCQVKYQETFLETAAGLQRLSDPVPLHFLSTLLNSCCLFPCDCFPCITGNHRCFESRTQRSVSQIRQVQEEGDCISGTLFLHSLSATEHVSFPLSLCWKLSIPAPAAQPSAIRTRRRLPAGGAGSCSASQSSH